MCSELHIKKWQGWSYEQSLPDGPGGISSREQSWGAFGNQVKPGVPWSLISTWLQNLKCLQHLVPLVIDSGFSESHKSTFSWQDGRFDLIGSKGLVVKWEENQKNSKIATVFLFVFRWGHEGAVRLQPPGGQLVPGDPAEPREGQLRHRALQQPALHHRGAGREERGHRHGAVLGPGGSETDRGVRPAQGGVAPRQRDHQEVVHPYPEDRAWSSVGVTAGARPGPPHPSRMSCPLQTAGGAWALGQTAEKAFGSPWGAPRKSQLWDDT